MRQSYARMLKACHILVRAVPLLCLTGCAIHYVDSETGTHHLWGFGHMKMKVAPPNEGLQAVVLGTDVLGLSIGSVDRQGHVTVGWHRSQRLDVVAEDTAIRFEWPSSDFAQVNVGSEFPVDSASEPAPQASDPIATNSSKANKEQVE